MAMTAGRSSGFDPRVAHPARVYDHVGRPRDVVAQFFAGLDLLEPGLVEVTDWRPRSDPGAWGSASLWGGVGRKP
jgi:S-adenosyl methyltransferase